MKQLFIALVATLSVLAGPAVAQQASEPTKNSEQARNPVQQQMDTLTAQAFDLAFEAISRVGRLYPFALYIENGKIKSIAFNASSSKKVPEPDKWVAYLFQTLQQKVRQSEAISAASIARLHRPEGEDGVLGVWVLTDHRKAAPIIAFLPLIKQKDGDYEPSKLVYSGASHAIFPHSESSQPTN